eukprot:m.20243 g.20243  ORF g.20243 m.20243 type:complete len:91 (-) comp5230_c0_seq1:103-375(-)
MTAMSNHLLLINLGRSQSIMCFNCNQELKSSSPVLRRDNDLSKKMHAKDSSSPSSSIAKIELRLLEARPLSRLEKDGALLLPSTPQKDST